MVSSNDRPRAGWVTYALMTMLGSGCAPWAEPADLDLPDAHLVEGEDPDEVVPLEDSSELPQIDSPPADEIRCSRTLPLDHAVPVEGPEHPNGGAMQVREGDRWMGLPLRHTAFDVAVVGTVADTTVTQTFVNTYEHPIEAVYTFPLPHDGAVDRYSFELEGRTVDGRIKLRAEARRLYEEAKERGNTAGLLEQERPNIFTQSLANIPAGATVDVEIHLVQPLAQAEGQLELVLPTVVGPRYIPGAPTGQSGTGVGPDTTRVPDGSRISPPVVPEGYRTCGDLSISVLVDAGTPLAAVGSPSHAVAVDPQPDGAAIELDEERALLNQDFVLRWRPRADQTRASMLVAPHDAGQYFTLTVQPPDPRKLDPAPRELVFVLDNSGSMSGVPMETSKSVMRKVLAGMRPEDSFQVLRFSESASGMGDDLIPATRSNVEKALAYVDALHGMGGTEMHEGIRAALELPRDPDKVRMVLFLTDGYIGYERTIFDVVARSVGDTRIFGLGVGDAPNRYLLDGLARMGKGTAYYVNNEEDPRPIVQRIYRQLDAPALTNIEVDWGEMNVTEVVPASVPDLFAGQPVVLYGKLEGKGGLAVVRGRRGGERVEVPVIVRPTRSNKLDGVRSMWARTRIDDLLMDPKLAHERERYQKFVEREVTRLSLAHSVLTEYTAFVAIDTEDSVESTGRDVTIVQGTEKVSGMASNFTSFKTSGTAGSYRTGGLAGKSSQGGLGLVGTGRGGGGTGQGSIGLGNTSLVGKGGGGGTGSGYGRGSGAGFGGKGQRIPRVRQARASVQGAIDRDIIRRIVRAHINEVRYCYNQGLASDPNLAGRVSIEFVIGAVGKVLAAAVKEDGLADEKVGLCIAKAVEKWKFPRAADGGTVVVRYPFLLSVN